MIAVNSNILFHIREDDTRTKYLYLILDILLCNAESDYLTALLTFYCYKAVAVSIKNYLVFMTAFLPFWNYYITYSAAAFGTPHLMRFLLR